VFDPPGDNFQIRGVVECVAPGGDGHSA